MNEASKNRLLLLFMAGMLLIGGAYLWTQRKKSQESPAVAEPRKAALPTAKPINTLPVPSEHISNLLSKTSEQSKQHAQLLAAAEQAATDEGSLKALQGLSKPQRLTSNTSPAPAVAAPDPADLNNKQPLTAQPSTEPIKPTPRLEAAIAARLSVGRNDPYEGIVGLKPFPSRQAVMVSSQPPAKLKPDMVPPPPPVLAAPPPAVLSTKPEPNPEVPSAAQKPSISESLKLVAVIGDRAMLAFRDPAIAAQNHWPPTLSLGVNEHFGDLNVIQVTPDSVVLDEDGSRCVKNIQSIK